MYRSNVLVCGGTGCSSSNSQEIMRRLEEEIKKKGLEKEVNVVCTGCFGLCSLGPVVIVYPEGSFYSKVTLADIPEIVEEHLLKGRIVKRLLYQETIDNDAIHSLTDTPFYKKQKRIALRNCGVINPEVIEEYIAMDGYSALGKVLTEMKPEEVIQVIKDSGLRGRGGGGFPTGLKWSLAAQNDADQKYVCCNADEGDPGAFMDRSVLEGDPHSVLEAMAIAGYAIGATQGYIYIRAEYPIAVERLQIAIQQARELGLLGKNIFDSGFDFDIELRLGSGAFVCGEETSLLASIEGHRGEPRPRPPYPAVKGLYGKPTILNNVETYANIAQIILHGAEWFQSIGTERSKGTKVFALGGKIKHTGLVEVPMGTTLREIVEEIGGGVSDGGKFKAAQTGGPSGTCMVDIAEFFLRFTVDESCGKCTACRIGTKRLLEMLEKITSGRGEDGDIEKLESLCHYIKDNSLCALGQTAPNPVLSTLQYFRDEYVAHVHDHRCPAGACKELTIFKVLPEKCIGCTKCARNCPVGAIHGNVKEHHFIDMNKCIKCGVCMENCKFNAIVRE